MTARTAKQIVTLTFSPTLDVATSVDVVTPSRKLRCESPRFEPGGGGINVARVAQRLGADVIAVAPLGGDRGQLVHRQLESEGVLVEQIVVDHTIRQSFAVIEESTGHQFRFVLPPHPLDPDDARRCVEAACTLAEPAACLVVSGSIDLPDVHEVLKNIVALVDPTPVLIDTSGAALDAALHSGAALVKPSARELTDLVGRALRTEGDIITAAIEVIEQSNVGALLVSIGSGGAVLARKGTSIVRFRAPTVQVRSAIGAGDSLVAGIATGLARGSDLVEAIRLGIAAGTATVLTEGTELCDPDAVEELLPLVIVDS
jgi:6-phosphofructokinase 2